MNLSDFLGGLDGASAHDASWLEATAKALHDQGVAAIADLDGAAYEDFTFPQGQLDAAQKRLVRAAITAASTPAPAASVPATAPAPSAADNAAALLAALKTGTTEARLVSQRRRARAAPRARRRSRPVSSWARCSRRLHWPTSRKSSGPGSFARARGIWRPGSRVGSSEVLDAFNAEVVKRQKRESGEGGTRVLLYSDIRNWLPEWARSGPRDVEEAADASCSASKEIRDLAKARPARVDGFGSPGRGRLPSRKSRR